MKLLLLCTGNSCRSHMAEGILRKAAEDLVEFFSARRLCPPVGHPEACAAGLRDGRSG